jgi:ATP-dependent Clp protease ATP-binding subunit ClpA
MFEHYVENARRTISFARYEAAQFGSPEIFPEHILLGLLRDDLLLANGIIGGSEQRIRDEIFAYLERQGRQPPPANISLSRESEKLLAVAREEADRLADQGVNNHHILLAMLRMENCFAAEVLKRNGLSRKTLQEGSSSTHREPKGEHVPHGADTAADPTRSERELHELQGRVIRLFQLSDYQGALKLVNNAIADQRLNHCQTIRTLGGIASVIARTTGDIDLARHYCEQRVACDPDDAMALYELADCVALQGKTNDANEIASRSYKLCLGQKTAQDRGLAELIEHRFPEIKSET